MVKICAYLEQKQLSGLYWLKVWYIPKWHSGKYANDFSSYFRNNGIWLRKFILNTIYSGVTVRTSLWLMDDKNKVLPWWIEPCVYIHKLCSDSLFHIKFLHNAWFHLTLIPIQLDPGLSGWIFQLKKYSGSIYKYWLRIRLLELKHVTWYPEITWEVELLSGQFRVWYFCKVFYIFLKTSLWQNGQMLFIKWTLIFTKWRTSKKRSSRVGKTKCGGVKVKVFHFGSRSAPEWEIFSPKKKVSNY